MAKKNDDAKQHNTEPQRAEDMEQDGNSTDNETNDEDRVTVPREAVDAMGGIDARRIADEDPAPEPPNGPRSRPQQPDEEASGA